MESAADLVDSHEPTDVGSDHADGAYKRKRWEFDGADEYEDPDEDCDDSNPKDDCSNIHGIDRENSDNVLHTSKRARRHAWQAKYEMEYGLIAIERDTMTNDVTLAMCGFCKAFGREGKYEQLIRDSDTSSMDAKKRRRRSLTTTKFFRAFRVDNIRSHLQGAHPRRWAEFELLPKQENIRARFFEFHYEGLPMVEDVLGGSALNADTEIAYAQAQADALASESRHHTIPSGTSSPSMGENIVSSTLHETLPRSEVSGNAAQLNSAVYSNISTLSAALAVNSATAQSDSASNSRSNFSYEKHLQERLALDRERLEFDKAKFKKEVEMREQVLQQQQESLEQEYKIFEARKQMAVEHEKLEAARLKKLSETIRLAVDNCSTETSRPL